MDNYARISDSLETLSSGQIVQKRRKAIIPTLCLFIGLLLMWWGIENWSKIGYEYTSYVLVFGGLFVVGWGLVMLTFNSYYEVQDTGELIKPQKVYLDPDSKDVVLDLLKKGDLNSVLQKGITGKSPLILEVWQTEGHKLVYSQLIYRHQDVGIKPISEAAVIDKSQISEKIGS